MCEYSWVSVQGLFSFSKWSLKKQVVNVTVHTTRLQDLKFFKNEKLNAVSVSIPFRLKFQCFTNCLLLPFTLLEKPTRTSHPCRHFNPFQNDSCSSLILHGFLASTRMRKARNRNPFTCEKAGRWYRGAFIWCSFFTPPPPALNFCSMAFLNFPGLFYSAFNDACKIISGFVCLFP